MASAARFVAPFRKIIVMLNYSASRRQRSARWDDSLSKVRLRWLYGNGYNLPQKLSSVVGGV